MPEHLTIAVVGAGIGGLAAAALLHDHGHRVTLFDQFEAPRPIGSGLVIQPVGQGVLAEIGCLDAALDGGAKITRMFGHEVTRDKPVLDVRYGPDGGPTFGLGIHRATLFAALWRSVIGRGIPLRADHRIMDHQGGWLTLSDGNRIGPFDLVVDAAGASSPLSPLQGRPLPYGAIWGTVDWPESTPLPRHELRQAYRKADRMIGVLPLGPLPENNGAKAAVFWSLPASDHRVWIERGLDAWKDEATSLWPEFAPFGDQIADSSLMTMARYSHGTLRKPWGDGIVHIGDAAHRASPQLGQGANMALLDASALACALTLADAQNPLALYAKARRAHVWVYQSLSAAFTPQYQSGSIWLPKVRDHFLTPLSQTWPITRILTSLVCGTLVPPLASLSRH